MRDIKKYVAQLRGGLKFIFTILIKIIFTYTLKILLGSF